MKSGLITSLMLEEDYVVHVLGFQRSTLNEGKYSLVMQQEILEAHLLAEGWFSHGFNWLKDKGVEGYEAVKDKALEIPNAIKEFGSDIKGVVAGLTAMVKDPEEAKAYSTGIMGSVRRWPKNVIKGLAKIAKWMEDHQMPAFAKVVTKIKDLLDGAWQKVKKMSGWIGSVSMLAFGLATKYVEEEFGILEKVQTARNYISDPEELVNDIKDTAQELGSEALENIKDFFSGKITAVVEDSDLFKQIAKFLEEKLGFIQTIKDKFLSVTTKVAGKALEQFAGPIAWVKQLAELFQSSKWVVGHLASMMQRVKIDVM